MKQRALALLLAAVLVLSLFAGCGSQTAKPTEEKEPKPAKSEEKNELKPEETPAEPDVTPEAETVPEPTAPTAEEINEAFDAFCADFLLLCFGDDVYSWNALVADPANFGYERDPELKAEWYEYCGEYTEESQEYYDELLAARETFNSFDREMLTQVNQSAYDTAAFFFNHSLIAYSPEFEWDLIGGDYISQYGGYVADFASCVENYKYRTYQDYVDIIDMTASTIDMFPTYLDFAQDRIAAKIPLSDFTLDKMITYLDGIIEQGDSYYLYTLYALSAEKACADGVLTVEEYSQLVADFTAAMDDCFFPAVESLRSELENYKGKLKNPTRSYVAYAKDYGTDYYKWLLEEKLGYEDLDLDDYEDYLWNIYETTYYLYDDSYKAMTDAAWAIVEDGSSFLGMTEYDEMMTWLISAADAVVPALETTPEISFKDADESIQEFVNYLAYYNLSPLDESGSRESVTINPIQFVDDASNLLDTLAHEGYPGHLYQHVHSKELGVQPISMLLSNTGATEGWAQYASYAIFMTASDNSENEDEALALRYLANYNYFMYINSAMIDFFVNGRCMTAQQIGEMWGVDREVAVEEFIHYCDENVAGIAPYGIGFAKIVGMHNQAKNHVSNYDEVAFNAWLLQDGKPYLSRMEDLTDQYVAADGNVG